MAAAAQFVTNADNSDERAIRSPYQNSFSCLNDTLRDGTSQLPWNPAAESGYGSSHTLNCYMYGRNQPTYGATSYPTETIRPGYGGYDQVACSEPSQLAWGGYSTLADHLGVGSNHEISPWCQESGELYNAGYYPARTTGSDYQGVSSEFEAPDWTPWMGLSTDASPWSTDTSPWTGSSPWIMPRWYQTTPEMTAYPAPYMKEEKEEHDVRPTAVSTPLIYQGKNETGGLSEIPSLYNRTLQPYNHAQLRDLLLTSRNASSSSARFETETSSPAIPPAPSVDVTAVTSHPVMTSPAGVTSLLVKLCNAKLWRQFHACTNEMIITKAGRRIFPTLQFSLEGLEKNRFYTICVDMLQVGNSQWKYQSSRWMQSGKAHRPLPKRVCVHPESPQSGEFWTSRDVIFNKLKLTNSKTCCESNTIILHSMHRYQPRVHVIEISMSNNMTQRTVHTHAFPETQFIAVTAYQNTDITQLKIDHNPFAKGFRDSQECCQLFSSSSGACPTLRTTHDAAVESNAYSEMLQMNSGSSMVTSTWKSPQTDVPHWRLSDSFDTDVFTSSPEQTVPNPGLPVTYFSAV